LTGEVSDYEKDSQDDGVDVHRDRTVSDVCVTDDRKALLGKEELLIHDNI